MRSTYELVVFDWEGTIADTLGHVLHTLASEAKNLGFGDVGISVARSFVGLGLEKAVKKLYPRLNLMQQEQLLETVHATLLTKPSDVCILPGLISFVRALKNNNIEVAVATNKSHASLVRALQGTELAELFKVTRSAGQVPPKPSPQMLSEIMDVFEKSAAVTLMIGDSVTDIEMAKSLKVDAIGMDYYHQQERVLLEAGALAVFSDYKQLAGYLNISLSEQEE